MLGCRVMLLYIYVWCGCKTKQNSAFFLFVPLELWVYNSSMLDTHHIFMDCKVWSTGLQSLDCETKEETFKCKMTLPFFSIVHVVLDPRCENNMDLHTMRKANLCIFFNLFLGRASTKHLRWKLIKKMFDLQPFRTMMLQQFHMSLWTAKSCVMDCEVLRDGLRSLDLVRC